MIKKKKIQVCFTSDEFNKYADGVSTVVVIDLLRATSVISTAFECGIESVIPVQKIEDALKFKNKKNHIIAAERNTLPIDGFNYGNSPFHYLKSNVIGKTLVLTTTNGTKAIHNAKTHKVITASFINLNAVINHLVIEHKSIIINCSGWKGLFNLEDTILAGALAKRLLETNLFISNSDSLYAAIELYNSSKKNLFEYLSISSYRKRNNSDEVINDTHFCLNPPFESNIVPIFQNDRLIKSE